MQELSNKLYPEYFMVPEAEILVFPKLSKCGRCRFP